MKIELKISENIIEPYAVIYASSISEEVQKIISAFEIPKNIIASDNNGTIIIINPDDVYLVRVENSDTIIYCKNNQYLSKKRLYEISEQLGDGFMQISKSSIVNLKQLDCVEPFFNGMMNLKLKNGCSDYISRKYLPSFKKYLGI